MRLFISINLNPSMKSALIETQDAFYKQSVRGNYTCEENLHLTLAFIEEYPDPQDVMDALSDVQLTPFPIKLDGIGAYGDLWWAGIGSSPALEAVVRRIRRSLAENNIPFDRKKFSPHITLLRKASVFAIPAIAVPTAGMTVDTISLMRSDRGRNGMIYTEVGTITAEYAM